MGGNSRAWVVINYIYCSFLKGTSLLRGSDFKRFPDLRESQRTKAGTGILRKDAKSSTT